MVVRNKSITAEDQVSENKKRLQKAEEINLIQSWLSFGDTSDQHENRGKVEQQSADGSNSALPRDSDHRDDAEQSDSEFSITSDSGGLGFTRPKNISTDNDSSFPDRQNLNANEKLRRQFLGKNSSSKQHLGHIGHSMSTARPKASGSRKAELSEDDELEGRTSVMVTKPHSKVKGKGIRNESRNRNRNRNKHITAAGESAMDSTSAANATTTASHKPTAKKRATSYLDEMLAKRGSKKLRRSGFVSN